MRALWLAAAALVAVALPTTTRSVAAQTTTGSIPASDAGQFVLQRSAKSADPTNVIEIVRTNDDGSSEKPVMEVQTIASSTDWKLDFWDASVAKLESQLKTLAPALTHLDLVVRLDQPLAFQNLLFAHDTPWSYGPTLVFTERSLNGLQSLKTLNFVKFNVTFEDKAWLPPSASLKQLVFDQCTVPFFTVDTTAVFSEVVFRKSNLTAFPNFLLHLKTPIKTLTFENNQIVRPISMTSSELEQLKSIPSVVFKGNVFVAASTSASTESQASAPVSAAPVASSACDNPTTYKDIPICVSDLTFRSANKSKIIADDSDGKAGSSSSQSATPAGSSKLMTSVIVILSVCAVAIVAIGSIIYRKRQRSAAFSGDTRSSFYENSDVLLSPSRLEAAAAAAATTAAVVKDDSPVIHTQSSVNSVGVAELDLGREVIHLGKKLGVHGLRKGEYRDAPVVALRVSLRSLHISMREVNRIVSSYVPFRHRNIVELIGTSMTALEDLLIVVEYMGKGSLRSVLRNPKIELPWHDRVRMSADIVRAIEFLHSTRPTLVSKNLTSKSVLCSNDLVCKLDIFDYGRKVRDHAVPVLNFGQCEIAARAPEVLAGGPVTRAAEVYALGVIFCEISLRQMPFESVISDRGATLGDLFIAREVMAQRLQLAPSEDAPAEYQSLATQCLSFDPARRPTVSEIMQHLQSVRT